MPTFSINELTTNDSYRLLISSYLPRPIAWVSTIAPDGIKNLAPFSFSMAICPKPFTLAFAPMWDTRRNRFKDTINNLREIPECVIHIASEDLVEKMNLSSAEVESNIDEFTLAGLTPIASDIVKPFRIAEAKIAYEARVHTMLEIGEGEGSATLVIVTVERMHIADEVWESEKKRIKLDALKPVARLAGNFYLRATDIFELKRP